MIPSVFERTQTDGIFFLYDPGFFLGDAVSEPQLNLADRNPPHSKLATNSNEN